MEANKKLRIYVKELLKGVREYAVKQMRLIGNHVYGKHSIPEKYVMPHTVEVSFVEKMEIIPVAKRIKHDIDNFWGAGCIAINHTIYMTPVDGTAVLKLDCKSLEIKFVKSVFGSRTRNRNNNMIPLRYTGVCCHKNSLYFMPRSANSIMKMDLKDEKIDIIDLHTDYTEEHHYHGAVSNGILYQPPRNTDHILAIDLNDYGVRKIPVGFGFGKHFGKYRYSGVVSHPNGFLYMIPDYNEKVIKFNPKTEQISFIGNFLKDSRLIGPTVGKDGNIYGFLMFGGGILKIDVDTDSVEILSEHIYTGCCGTECGVNGKLYGIPAYRNKWFEFDIDSRTILELSIADDEKGDVYSMCACAGGTIDEHGNIFTVPCHGKRIYYLDFMVGDTLSKEFSNFIENGY